MRFYLLKTDNDGSSPYWGMRIDEELLTPASVWDFSRGENCDIRNVPCQVSHPGVEADFNADGLTSTPIVSTKLACLVREIAGHDVQCIPAVVDATGEWTVLNPLAVVNAMDLELSVVKYADENTLPKRIKGVMRLIIDSEKVDSNHIFRVGESPVNIVVSDVVKDRCQHAEFSNMRFVPASFDEWNEYLVDPSSEKWCTRPWKTASK